MPKISQRLIYRMPYQRRTKWNSQFTQEQVAIFAILGKECRAIPWHSIPAISVLHQQCDLPRYARVCQVRVLRDPVTWGEDHVEYQKTTMRKVFFLEVGEKLPICIACAQDFIWLHDVIQENLQYAGFIIPPKVRMAFILNDSLMYSSKLNALWTKLVRLACCPFRLNVFKNNLSSSHPTLTSTHQGKSYR